MDGGQLLTWGLTASLLAALGLLAWRLRRRAFVTLCASLVVAAVLGEGALRVLGVGIPTRPEWVEPLTGELRGPAYRPGGTLYYRYPSDPRGAFDPDGAVVGHINALGLRGPECELAKRPGTTRVAVLGDSFTLGIGVRDEDSLPARLERALGRPDIEVLNFGVSATQTVEHVRYLEGYALGFEPDVVVLVYFLNDAERDSTIQYLSVPHAFVTLRRHSWLANATVGALERVLLRGELLAHYRAGYEEHSESWRLVRDELRRAKALLDRKGIAFVVAIHPVLMDLQRGRYPFSAIHEQLAETCRAERIDVVDLLDALAGQRASDLWVHPNDQHPNELAHARSAELLAEHLRRGLLAR